VLSVEISIKYYYEPNYAMTTGGGMDCDFSEDQEQLRANVRRFLNDRCPIESYVRSMWGDERGTSAAVWSGLSEMGISGLLIPQEFGGSGGTMVDMGVVLEEMGRLVHPGPFLSSAVGATTAICLIATVQEQAELLPSLADGSIVATIAMMEPGERIGWHSELTTAHQTDAGWQLRGAKSHVADAMHANVILFPAKVNGEVRLFLVEANSIGLQVAPVVTVDGSRSFASVLLNGVPARLLGSGDATKHLDTVLDNLLVAYVVDGVGTAQAALDMSVEYAKQRIQFNRPIGSFQAVQHLLADMLMWVELGRSAAYFSLWSSETGSLEDRHRTATLAKAYVSDAFFRVGASAIQVFGGVGYTWEHDVHLYYKRLLTLQQILGGSADHFQELADLILS